MEVRTRTMPSNVSRSIINFCLQFLCIEVVLHRKVGSCYGHLYRTTPVHVEKSNSTFNEISGSPLFQTTNYGLSQTHRVCRRQFQIRRKWWKVLQKVRKHEQFLLFPQCFQKTCSADT